VKSGIPLIVTMLLACAPVGEPGSPGPGGAGPAEPAPRATGESTLVPAGLGTLRQDDFTVSLRSGALLVKVTPLSETVIRLAAPDTYERLNALAQSRQADAQLPTGQVAEMFLVSFFSYQPNETFQPEDLQLMHQGRMARPARILAITPGWGSQRLRQQETQTAIYLFEPGIDYDQPMVVRYGIEESSEWNRIIPRLEVERAKVQARVGS
jgi:hypothetical protein